jgi:type II secretory pathway component PulM
MVDKKINADHDEYQFPADEYVSSAEKSVKEDEPTAPLFHDEEPIKENTNSGLFSNIPLLRNKRVVVAIGVGAVMLIAYKMMQPSPVQKVVAAAPVPTVVQPQVNPQMSSEISDLQQALQNNQASVNQLQTQLQSVNSALTQTAQNQASNQAAIEALTKQVTQLSVQVKQLQAVGTKVPVAKYHVKAVQAGRAWIVNSHGLEQTVRVGDIVPQYGEVTAINESSGEVTTNSGRTIRYGTNDV